MNTKKATHHCLRKILVPYSDEVEKCIVKYKAGSFPLLNLRIFGQQKNGVYPEVELSDLAVATYVIFEGYDEDLFKIGVAP